MTTKSRNRVASRPKSAPLQTSLTVGGEKTPATVRINNRARRLIVRVDPIDRRVLVTAPTKSAVPAALAFARSREEWIMAQLEDATGPMPFTPGRRFPFRGVMHRVKHEGGPRARVALGPDRTVSVGGEKDHINRRVTDWLKKRARAAFIESAGYYADLIGVNHGQIRIRDTKSRWGSCTRDGVLTFSWRLILAPQEILDYVAAHECAHLVHLDHSPKFWRLVEDLGVDADGAKEWFDANGQSLFAWGMDGSRT